MTSSSPSSSQMDTSYFARIQLNHNVGSAGIRLLLRDDKNRVVGRVTSAFYEDTIEGQCVRRGQTDMFSRTFYDTL